MINEREILAKALEFAKDAHAGQTRKFSGKAYITHPFKVYKRLKKWGVNDDNILTAAILHDTIEDTHRSYGDIKTHFNKDVADIVDWLSIKGGKASYIKKMMKNAPYGAVLIKTFDRIDNLNDGGSKAWQEKYKLTSDIIRSGLKKRGFTSLYNEYMKTYTKIYGE
jgi:(p)ppGpp synthase/HD superfamily hydrolase